MPLPIKKLRLKMREKGNKNRMPLGYRIAALGALFWTVVWISSGFDFTAFWWFLLFAVSPFFFIPKFGRQPNEEVAEPEVINDTIEDLPAIAAPLHTQILKDAEEYLLALKGAAAVASGGLGENLRDMVASVEKVSGGIRKDPSQLSQVQRLFTYYLPATTDLLKARGNAASANDSAGIDNIDEMLGRLKIAFSDFGKRLHGQDARSLEIDIKLLGQSLNQEFDIIMPKDKVQ